MAQAPITTIPPFGDAARLPDCAKSCGPLYDANGACVPPGGPPAEPAAYTACFCADARVAPFAAGPAGVCDQACPANAAGLQSIAAWFQGICKPGANAPNAGNPGNKAGDNAAPPTDAPRPANPGGGGDWLSSHWQWVIMLVVLVVGIAGIWIGACVWRRRYLRKKDRQTSLGQKHSGSAANPSWGPAVTGSDSPAPMAYARDAERAYADKPPKNKERKKWTVSQRTCPCPRSVLATPIHSSTSAPDPLWPFAPRSPPA